MTSLNPTLRIGAQVGETLRVQRGASRAAARAAAAEMLDLVGLPRPREQLDRFPHELSGGMRQRVVIAAALICEPRLLIADEPTTALDVTTQAQILELFDRLRQTLGHGHAADHPRHGRGGRPRRPGVRHVRGPGGRDRAAPPRSSTRPGTATPPPCWTRSCAWRPRASRSWTPSPAGRPDLTAASRRLPVRAALPGRAQQRSARRAAAGLGGRAPLALSSTRRGLDEPGPSRGGAAMTGAPASRREDQRPGGRRPRCSDLADVTKHYRPGGLLARSARARPGGVGRRAWTIAAGQHARHRGRVGLRQVHPRPPGRRAGEAHRGRGAAARHGRWARMSRAQRRAARYESR